MTFRGHYGIHFETAFQREYATLSTNGNNQYIECFPENSVIDYDTQLNEILESLFPHGCVETILSFNHELCFNKVLMCLYDAGMMKKCHNIYDHPISIRKMLDLVRQNTYCNLKLTNGGTLYLIPPIGRIQRDVTFFVRIVDSDIFVEQSNFMINRSSTPSLIVHGRFKDLGGTSIYFKYMEALFEHFGHDGSMISVYKPDRANLNRTSYEVMMICLKRAYTAIFGDKQFYWKIDKRRIPRVLKIETLIGPKVESIGLVEKVKLPEVPIENLYKKLKIVKEEDRVDERVENYIQETELDLMRSEDINALDCFPGYKSYKDQGLEWKFVLTPEHEEMLKKTPYRYAKVKDKKTGQFKFKILSRPFVIKEEHGDLKNNVRKAFIDASLKLEQKVKEGTARVDEKGYQIFEEGKNPRSAVHPPQLTRFPSSTTRIIRGAPKGVWKKDKEKCKPQSRHPPVYKKVKTTYWTKNPNRITKEELGRQCQEKWQQSVDLKMAELLKQVTPMQEYIKSKPRKMYNKHFHEAKPVYKMQRMGVNVREANRLAQRKKKIMKERNEALSKLNYVGKHDPISDSYTLRMYNYAFFVATGIKSIMMMPTATIRYVMCQMRYHIRDINTGKTKKWRVKKSEREVYVRFFEMLSTG